MHLGNHMLQKQQRAIVDTGQACTKAAREPLVLVLLTHKVFFWFPFHPKRGVGEHVVEFLFRVVGRGHKAVVFIFGVFDTQGIAKNQVVDGGVFNQQV